jgi:signal transduction histidine kinase
MASPSGILELGDLAPSAHVGHLYRNKQDLLETLVPFFVTGLARNERCIWVTFEPLCAADARAALAAQTPDLAHRECAGDIEIVDHDAWYARAGTLDPDQVIDAWLEAEERAMVDGYTGLRVSGNMSWARGSQWQELADYEARVHTALKDRRIIALCSYGLDGCHSQEIVDVMRNHPTSLVRADSRWSVVHGATAALATLELELPARAGRDQLVRLEHLANVLAEVTTRLELARVVRDIVSSALEADGIVVVEFSEQGESSLLVGHGSDVDSLHLLADSVDRAVWSSSESESGTELPGGGALRSVAALPLYAHGKHLGACVFGFVEPRPLSATYRALAQDVIRQLALALDRACSYERIAHERARAEQASRAKDEFLAMLGHELRNPLSPILTASQLMRMRGGDEHERERTVIERQVKHISRLVDDLLDVSRITQGKVELRRRAVDLADIITQATELASPAFENRAHRFVLDAPQSGIIVHADTQRLVQVLCNLLTNAAKYTPANGEIKLTVRTAASTVSISVKDNGLGIDSKLLPNIFDLFVQGRQGIDRASGGLGLGLAIARSLCEMHGGMIRAHSEGPGLGSEFVVELPRFANTRPAKANVSGAFKLPTVRGRRVLVVDDNEDAAFLFSEALKRLGHHVEVAYDGPSAIALAREQPPEIAFLDIGLPVMDGYELGRRLRELGGTPPRLVAVTGYGHSSDRERSRDAGFDLHLVKPIEIVAVQEAIAKFD